jgi:hypothetical protein
MNACEKEAINAIRSLVILSRVITTFEWTGCILLVRNGLDVAPLQKPGKCRSDIQLAALRQTCQVRYSAPPIE